MKSRRVEVSAEAVLAAVTAGATSLTAVSKSLGFHGSVSSSTAKTIRGLVHDIDARLAANKAGKADAVGSKKVESVGRRSAVAASAGTAAPPRHPSNPYRVGLYATIYDCMATPEALRAGMSRERLTAMAAAILKRDPRLVGYGVTVVCSAAESATGPRHRSAREGYHCERKNGWVRLVLPSTKP